MSKAKVPYRKDRGSSTNSSCAIETLKFLSLDKFCCKKFYQIEFVTPLTPQDHDLLDEIVRESRKFEYLSDVHFITVEDVFDLLERLVSEGECDLPKNLIQCAQEQTWKKLQDLDPIPSEFLALATKLKIIESLYKQYRTEVNKMRRRQKIHEELTSLLNDNEQGNKKNKKEKKSNQKTKSTKKESKTSLTKTISKTEIIIDDCTEIPLEDDELIFDFNIDNHLIYVILSGFRPFIIEKLAKIQVEISAVIDVASSSSDPAKLEDVIMQLEELFQAPQKCQFLEKTAWLKYRACGGGSSKEILEEFLFVAKRINYIKRQHLSYLRNLKLCNLGSKVDKVEAVCLEKYSRLMDSYPNEFAVVPLIVSSLVEEVCWRESGQIHSLSDLTPTSSESEMTSPRKDASYQTHEEDLLKICFKAYSQEGRQYYDKSLEYLKLLYPLNDFQIPHEDKYLIKAVSTEDFCYCNNISNLYDYFHLAIFNQMKREEFLPKKPEQYEFLRNLETYDQVKEYRKALPKTKSKAEITANDDVIVYYHMKEDLSTSVLRQLIFKAINSYSSLDRDFCHETNSFLLRFHDNIDSSGVDTKIWCQNLRTPVCLRDFCRFVAGEERKCLEKIRLPNHEDLNYKIEEKCEGLIDLNVPELYEEYRHLLDSSEGISSQKKNEIFEEALNEIINYPKSDVLIDFCDGNGTLLAYDLGPKHCQLTGHTSIFRSDDGVKVTVDTSRFLGEEPRCTITIDSDGNSLIFHKTKSSHFHFILKNETIINFSKYNNQLVEKVKEETDEKTEDSEEKTEEIVEDESKIPNYGEHWIQILRKSKMSSQVLNTFNNTTIDDKKVDLDDGDLNRLLELFKGAVFSNHPISKISTKPSLIHAKRKSSPTNLPMVGVLKRVLFKPPPKKRTIANYSIFHLPKIKKVHLKYDFQITLSNGLVTSSLPKNGQLTEVRQEYKYSRYKEISRTFYANGVIVIKNLDGSTTILRSNGDIIELTDESEYSSNSCAENINIFFKKEQSQEEASKYRSSRCEEPPKAKPKIEFANLYEFGDIPYSNKSLLEFNGKRINFSDGQVTEKHEYYVISERDYFAEEVLYEREDGMRCLVDKKGKQIYRFPDGTKISSWPEVEKEPIRVCTSSRVEPWVSVCINYKIEHRDYLTVVFDSTHSATEIFLQDCTFKNSKDSILMNIHKNIVFEVSSSDLTLVKTCDLCDSDCICRIHIDGVPKLLEMCDSYDKYLTSDSFGNCDISINSRVGGDNKNGCDHVSRNETEKFFVLNGKGPPGTIFWKDGLVREKIAESKNLKNVKMTNYINKLNEKHTFEFFTDVYQNFIGRFTMTDFYKNNVCLSKYKRSNRDEAPRLCYVTYRILTRFQNLQEKKELLEDIEKFLDSRVSKNYSALVEGLKRLLKYFSIHRKLPDYLSSTNMDVLENAGSVSQILSNQTDDLDKPTVNDVIVKWRNECNYYKDLIRNKKFTPYFHSNYYKDNFGVTKDVLT